MGLFQLPHFSSAAHLSHGISSVFAQEAVAELHGGKEDFEVENNKNSNQIHPKLLTEMCGRENES